jgi:tripartite ATP-independent transporter DctP family solute receptor
MPQRSISRLTLTLATALAMAVTAACGSGGTATSAEGETRELRLAHVFGIDSTQNDAAEAFADKLEEASDGRLTVAVYPASQLGGDEVLGQDLARGTLDMAFLNPGSLAGMDPMMDFHYLPYIVEDYEQADEVFFGDGIIPKTIEETLAKHDMTTLSTFELEFRAVTNNKRPVTKLSDLSGLKLRVPGSAAIRGFFDKAGVQTVVMPMPELITGLQQGTVDGQDNGALITRDTGLQKSQDYMTPTRHVYAIGTVAMSTKVFDSLSEEDQELINSMADEVTEDQVDANRARVDEYMSAIEGEGVEVHELSDQEMAEFREFGLSLWNDYAGTYGQERIDSLRAEVENLSS